MKKSRAFINFTVFKSFTASIPWKFWDGCKSCNHVEKCPCYNNTVVNIQEKHQAHSCYSNAFQEWTQLCHQSHSSWSQILTNGYFLKKHWDPTKDHGDEINYQKGTWNEIVYNVNSMIGDGWEKNVKKKNSDICEKGELRLTP